jgi:hypothetical protein
MNRATIYRWMLLGTVACAHPGEMGADQHRAAAAEHERDARAEMEKYDPAARVVVEGDVPFHDRTYNPTGEHYRAAHEQLYAAHQHLHEALELERFESEACADQPKAVRAACPLFSAEVDQVQETAWGVRLHLKQGSDAAGLIARMRCHLAFSRTRGFGDEPDCLLYFRGVGVDLVGLGEVIEVRAADSATAEKVRTNARTLLAPPPGDAHP